MPKFEPKPGFVTNFLPAMPIAHATPVMNEPALNPRPNYR
jgi:hypothetical protein